jgi:hypothetical protein
MNSRPDILMVPAPTGICDRPTVHIVTGRDEVLGLSEKLIEFSEHCGQSGAMHDLGYFLSKPGALPRVPHLLLVGAAHLSLENPDLDELLGVVLIFEHQVYGFRIRVFATNDRSGRGTLLARAPDRVRVAALAGRVLLDRGARLILMSFRATEELDSAALVEPAQLGLGVHGRTVARWTQRERIIPGYLAAAPTIDATLATVGTRTRRNLRYYRRRAEADLGCTFVAQVEISREEILSFSRECMYPVSAGVVGWRYDSLKGLANPVFIGMKDRDGRWLSLLGGRRYLDRSEILWQLNRDGLASYSLGTVMRSYFIENEIAHGARRLYAEGGTPHSIRFSFVPEKLTDLVLVRQTLVAKAIQRIAQHYIPKDNELSRMLSAPDLEWLPC